VVKSHVSAHCFAKFEVEEKAKKYFDPDQLNFKQATN
jgi:hypothetical protein